jgi:photosystem II stability/assembly factor-like uncharacterized protein
MPVRALADPLQTATAFQTPTGTPAKLYLSPSQEPLLALTQAGRRLVAVGLRGVITYSDDDGKNWKQASVPVETDLVSVAFSSPTHGWSVGHMGVVLETTDGGASWARRFVLSQIDDLVIKYYEAQQPAAKSPAARAASEALRSIKEGVFPSLLDVWFDSPTSGTIVGAFNTILRTEDGGRTWTPWADRVDNPQDLHFYAVRGVGGDVYIAGERGMVWRLNQAVKRWVPVPTGYAGTLFGMVAHGSRLVAFGMRGTVYTSDDKGNRWAQVPTPRNAGLTTGLLLRDGTIVLGDQSGALLQSTDGGRSFDAVSTKAGAPVFSLAEAGDGSLISVGARGVAPVSIR